VIGDWLRGKPVGVFRTGSSVANSPRYQVMPGKGVKSYETPGDQEGKQGQEDFMVLVDGFPLIMRQFSSLRRGDC